MSLFDKLKYRLNEKKKEPPIESGSVDPANQQGTFRKNERNKKKSMRDLENPSTKQVSNLDSQEPLSRTKSGQGSVFKDSGKNPRKKRSDAGQTRGKRNVKGSDNPDQITLNLDKNTKKIVASTDAKDAEIDKLDKKTIKAKPGAAKKESDLIDAKKKSLEIQKKSILNKSKKYASGEFAKVPQITTSNKPGRTLRKMAKNVADQDMKPLRKQQGIDDLLDSIATGRTKSGEDAATVTGDAKPTRKKNVAQTYTNKINRKNKNRPEGKAKITQSKSTPITQAQTRSGATEIRQRRKTFKKSFGTPTGADPFTGKPTYKPSSVSGKLGPDIYLPKNRGSAPTPKQYEKIAKKLGDREAAKSKYINPKTNKVSDSGMKKFVTKARQMRSGSNVPVDPKKTEKIIQVAKKEYTKKINTKYGGRRMETSFKDFTKKAVKGADKIYASPNKSYVPSFTPPKDLPKVTSNIPPTKLQKLTKPVTKAVKSKPVRKILRKLPGAGLVGLAAYGLLKSGSTKSKTDNNKKNSVTPPVKNNKTTTGGDIIFRY